MLCIKTGMDCEAAVAKQYAAPNVLVLTGKMSLTQLEQLVPPEVKAILSFGLCGGLAPQAAIGQIFLATTLVTPEGSFAADTGWLHRLFSCTRAYEVPWWSTGELTGIDEPQRAYLFGNSGCWVVDDESYSVAMLARKRNVPFAIMRSVSDGAEDNLPPAALDAINKSGSTDLWAIMRSVVTNPLQIPALVKTAMEYQKSVDELRTAAIQVGPMFQWQ